MIAVEVAEEAEVENTRPDRLPHSSIKIDIFLLHHSSVAQQCVSTSLYIFSPSGFFKYVLVLYIITIS